MMLSTDSGGALLTAQPALADDGYANCNVWVHYEFTWEPLVTPMRRALRIRLRAGAVMFPLAMRPLCTGPGSGRCRPRRASTRRMPNARPAPGR